MYMSVSVCVLLCMSKCVCVCVKIGMINTGLVISNINVSYAILK